MMKLRLPSKKITVIAIAVLLVGASGVFAYQKLRGEPESIATEPGQLDESGINYGPPTKEEKQQAEDHKNDVVNQMNVENQSPSSQKKAVTPVITYAQRVDNEVRVNAYVPGVFEDGGTCTFTFKNGDQTITKTTQGVANVSTTDCARLTFDKSELSAGSWQVTVSYSSGNAEGTSAAKTVD